MTDRSRPANRLAEETSPYLLQHAHNPVDWHPWGPEALEKARVEDKPLLVSIGYSACHWCHVMERESFEDEDVAGILNRHFVAVKVDREERPDVDHVYMTALQLITQQGGGWPLNVFCTPDGRPFHGGTYFPPDDRFGLPSFRRVLLSLAEAWSTRRDEIEQMASSVRDGLGQVGRFAPVVEGEIPSDLLIRAADDVLQRVDHHWGGLAGAPKFPNTFAFDLLLRAHRATGREAYLEAVRVTLDRMAAGGIYDHLGGAFARYSTDERWLVPHFEKMLYDNALLLDLYVDGYRVTGDERYRAVAEETAAFVLSDLADPAGGFYSTLDADSEGVEGKYYVWTRAEIEEILGAEAAKLFGRVYDVSAEGNWEGVSIPWRSLDDASAAKYFEIDEDELRARLARCREALLEVRARRVPPGRDEKILTAWNGLMTAALARAGACLGREDWVAAAEANAAFVWEHLRDGDGLLRSYKDGRGRFPAYVDDHAFYGRALLELFEATYDPVHLERARHLADQLLDRFQDPDGGFFFTSDDHEALAARTKAGQDGAIPSGNAVAADLLARLAVLTEEERYREAAERTLRAFLEPMGKAPLAFAGLVGVADRVARGGLEVVLVGPRGAEETRDLLGRVRGRYLPDAAVYVHDPSEGDPPVAFARNRPGRDGGTVAYVCRDRACSAPVAAWDRLGPLLSGQTNE